MAMTAFQQIFRQPPMNHARLMYTLIQALAFTIDTKPEHDAYRLLRACTSFADLATIDWTALEDALCSQTSSSSERIEESLSRARLVVRWAILHHELYQQARSSTTLFFTGRWRLPWYRFPPELDEAVCHLRCMFVEIDTQLKSGRTALSRFQCFASRGSSDLLTLQDMLQEASACLAVYQHTRKQALMHLSMISWYLDQVKQAPMAA